MSQSKTIQIGIDTGSDGLLMLTPEVATVSSSGDNNAQQLKFVLPQRLVEKYTAYDQLEIHLWNRAETFLPIIFDATQPETWVVSLTGRLTSEAALNIQAVFTKAAPEHNEGQAADTREASARRMLKIRAVSHTSAPPLELKPYSWNQFVGSAFTGAVVEGDTLKFQNLSGADVSSIAIAAATSGISPSTAVDGIEPGSYLTVGADGRITGAAAAPACTVYP